MIDIEEHYVNTNGVDLHLLQAGPPKGPLVILLHGFPEFSYAWRKQIPHLVQAGYRVWAPDQRGYNLSDKPKGIVSYRLDELAKDVIGLIDAAGEKQALLVGHDWGGAVAWHTATKYPDRIKRMVILNMPHGSVMKEHLRTNAIQRKRSQYIYFFQIPWLPEIRIRLQNYSGLRMALKNSSLPGTFSEEELNHYTEAWSKPKAYHSMINWYRAAFKKPVYYKSQPMVSVPTLLIWGELDKFLGIEMAQPSIDLCEDGHLVIIEGATHWVQHEKVEQVNNLITAFFENHGMERLLRLNNRN